MRRRARRRRASGGGGGSGGSGGSGGGGGGGGGQGYGLPLIRPIRPIISRAAMQVFIATAENLSASRGRVE